MSSKIEISPGGLARAILNASFLEITTGLFALIAVRWFIRGIYRVYFHPLSRFPGPKSAAFTRWSQIKWIWSGSFHRDLAKLHQQYGHVVRISPNELSFTHPDAWRDIHGHGIKGTRGSVPPKNWFRYGKPLNGADNLVTAREESQHAAQRRIFSAAFSDRALKEQEPLFLKHTNKLVQLLRRGLEKDPEEKFNMVRVYNFTTFDVMGDLTFGESLHMLDTAEYDPWVSIIFASVKFGTRFGLLHHYPWLYWTLKKWMPESFAKKRLEHFNYSKDRVTKRLEQGREGEGVDLWDLVLEKEGEKGLTRDEMDSNASLFMLAGTETTATLVSGLTYLLLTNKKCMEKVVKEIREAFKKEEDMTMERVAALPYFVACIKEAFRMYPPVATGLPHMTPPEGSTICGEFVPPGFTVTIPQYPAYIHPDNFVEPLSFIPDRWLGDARFANDQRGVVQPFSVGTRDCLGKNMAYHEMRMIMAKVLYNFDMELCPESEGWMDQAVYVLWEKKPLLVKLKTVAHA